PGRAVLTRSGAMRARRAGLVIWAVAALLAAGPATPQSVPSPANPGNAKTVPVDLELVLAVDVSRSIDADEFDLQRQGYARASINSGRPVWLARDAALEVGITINGLAIINDRPNPFSRPEPKLDDYYRENVIGGSGAFVTIAEDFQSFSSAILSKLIKEVAGE